MTRYITIRRATVDDAAAFVRTMGDPEVLGNLMQTPYTSPQIWRAQAGGRTLGWVIVDNVIGKHEFITYAAAISPDGHVLGIEVMTYRETKGSQVREARCRDRFRGKTLADPFRLEQDIPNISGATLSCRNITDGVKRLLALHAVALAHAG